MGRAWHPEDRHGRNMPRRRQLKWPLKVTPLAELSSGVTLLSWKLFVEPGWSATIGVA
jgi:hypothetical protein